MYPMVRYSPLESSCQFANGAVHSSIVTDPCQTGQTTRVQLTGQ